MLRNIHLANFKSWESLNISLGSVTGLFGTNSSGKSSVLQFLLMLKQTKNATDRGLVLDFGGPEQLVNLGNYQHLVHKHETSRFVAWQVEWALAESLEIRDPTGMRSRVLVSDSRFSVGSEAKHNEHKALVCDRLSYKLGTFEFSLTPKKAGATEFDLVASTPADSEFRFIRNQQRVWSLPGPLKTHLFPDQAKTYFQNSNFLGQLESTYESLMDSIFYLGPLREYPRREYPWSGASPVDVGRRGERTIEAILAATSKNELRNLGPKTHYKPFQEMIAYWLKKLGLITEFRIEEIGTGASLYRALVKRDSASADALLTDVGFGVSQVLPALVLLYYVPEGSTVLMEQPEIHLHPSVQSGLADVIIKVAKTRKLQIIVESHSEHMLRRFQRRVAEDVCSSDFVKLYFCKNSGGRSVLSNLEMDVFGQIGNWPENFFGDEMTEIAETRKAILQRKMQSTNQ